MNQAVGITLTSPKKLWKKDVKLSLKDTLQGLIKASIEFASGKTDAAGKSLIDIVFKGELETEAGEKAWVLVVNSMMSALKDLLSDQAQNINNESQIKKIDAICDEFAEKLGEVNYKITPQFFEQPEKLLTATKIQQSITVFFTKLGYVDSSAKALANRFPAYFTFALHREWRDNAAHYKPVFDAVDTPFTKASLQQEKLALYKTHLIKQAHESVFGELLRAALVNCLTHFATKQ
jgi:hypothetical protein